MKQNSDLHGNAPDSSPVALLLIDVINDLEFEGGEKLLRHALPAARRIADFKQRCVDAGIPAIYVNDNFGKWRSDFKKLVSHCLDDNTRGREIVELLKPGRRRLLRAQAKTFRLLFHHARSASETPGG